VIHPQTVTERRKGIAAGRALARLAGVAAAACCVGACSSGAVSTITGTPVTSTAPASQGASAVAVDRSVPGPVLADWMHQLVRGDYQAVCRDMRDPGLSAERSAAECTSAQTQVGLRALHANFTIAGIKPTTPISADAHITGNDATVSGGDVNVAGKTLESLVLASSTGVKPGELSIQFTMVRVAGKWYVIAMNLDA
jgi:hypothetical protein